MKTALITGSTGAVGTYMVRELLERGWEVTCFDLSFGRDCLRQFSDFNAPQYDLVVHLAALIGGRAGIDGVNLNFPYDLQLDAMAVQWAVRTRQRHFLAFSSSAAYPVYLQTKECHIKLREDNLSLYINEPDANYGLTKWVLEREVELARQNGLKCTVVRPFSGYSDGQSLDYPFPSIIKRAREGDLSVWGPQGQTRDWIHMSDVVKGALAVVESGDTRPVNLCTGRGTEMGELMSMAYGQAHGLKRVVPITYDETKPTGVFYRVGNPARMHEHYRPKISLEEGVRRALGG